MIPTIKINNLQSLIRTNKTKIYLKLSEKLKREYSLGEKTIMKLNKNKIIVSALTLAIGARRHFYKLGSMDLFSGRNISRLL